MNIRDLKYLVAIADYGHFGKAAEACFVTQPALSMQIKKLEEILGLILIERTNKSILITEQGQILVNKAREILQQVDELQAMAKLAKDPFQGELKIGIFPTLAPYFLPLIFPRLSKIYPKLSFFLLEEQTPRLLEKLKNGQLDAAFLSAPIIEKNIHGELLFQEEFLLAVGASHPFAYRKSIREHDLENQNILLLDEGHCLRDQALTACQRLHVAETQSFRATSLETLRHMIMSGVGVTFMPRLACTSHHNIAYIPFTAPKPSRTIGLYWRNQSVKQVAFTHICEKIRTMLSKHVFIKILTDA